MVEIKLVKHREKMSELLNLFQASFGRSLSAELWTWRYLENPLASRDVEAIVAVCDGNIVGARPFMPHELWIQDEKLKAALFSNTMVHPEYQRMGIFSKMNKFAVELLRTDDYTLFYNYPNRNSRPGYLKQGSKIVSTIEYLFLPINAQRLISYQLRNRLLGAGLGFFYSKLMNTKGRRPLHLSNSFQIETLDQLTDKLKTVDVLRDRSVISLVRSEAYLTWRFDKHPEHHYKYILVKRDGELLGYAVVGAEKWSNSLICGRIRDYLVKDKNVDCFRSLVARCIDELVKSGVDVILIPSFGKEKFNVELAQHLGFKSSLSFPYNRIVAPGCFTIRAIDEKVTQKTDIYDKQNWDVTFADSGEMRS